MTYCPVPQLPALWERLVIGEVRPGGPGPAKREKCSKDDHSRAGRSSGQIRSGQCERLDLNSLHRFMLRWLDHAQVEGIGGIIDHFYTEFGANPRSGEFTLRSEFTLLGRSALFQYRYAFTNNSPGVVSVCKPFVPALALAAAQLASPLLFAYEVRRTEPGECITVTYSRDEK